MKPLLPRPLVITAALLAVCLFSTAAGAQTRFTVVARDNVAAASDLWIVTIRDAAQDQCYLLFVVDTGSNAARPAPQRTDAAAAAASRDQQLAELSRYYEQHGFGSVYAGTPANVLPYQFEAQRIQAEYERTVRENELAWFQEQLERLLTGPRVAVSGPAPCAAGPTTTTR